MKNDKIVAINGQKYDIVSGLPVGRPAHSTKSTAVHKPTSATGVHSVTQKSKTLYRRATQKPSSHITPPLRKVGRSMDIARSKSITHFAPRPLQKSTKPATHPLTQKVNNLRLATQNSSAKPATDKTTKDIKDEAIEEAFRKLSEQQQKEKQVFRHRSRLLNIFLIIVGIISLVAIGYFIYLNVPTISVRVASAQAGISATFPEYHPDGYSLNGPVSYSDGQVTINFRANIGNSEFIIKQSKSSWDSSALKDKVNKDSDGGFVTTAERGLTIYTYGENATWVNGGILYSINGNAHLSGDQIRRIATSL